MLVYQRIDCASVGPPAQLFDSNDGVDCFKSIVKSSGFPRKGERAITGDPTCGDTNYGFTTKKGRSTQWKSYKLIEICLALKF